MSAVAEARALLAGAVAVGAISELMLAVLLSLGLSSLALFLLKPRGDRLQRDWPERARFTWPARKGGAIVQLFVPLLVGTMLPLLGGPLVPWSKPVGGLLLGLVAYAVTVPLRLRFERALHPEPERFSARSFLLGRAAFLCVMYGHLLFILGMAVAQLWLPSWAAIPGVLLALGLIWSWSQGTGVRLVGLFGLSWPADPQLTKIVHERALHHGLEEPTSVGVLDWEGANAFAFPLANRLVFTTGALAALDPTQIAGVADHELGHLAESRGVLVARTMTSMSYAGLVALVPAWRLLGPLGPAGLLVGVVLLSLLTGRLRRRMEERADEHAHGEDGPAYGRALEALYRHNRAPAVLGKGPHPDLVDRMRAAGVEPTWEVPEPPSKWSHHIGLGVAAAVALLAAPLRVGLLMLSWMGGPFAGIWGGSSWTELAWSHPTAEARLLFEAALEEDPHDEEAMAGRMQTLAGLGECEAAWAQSETVPEWWVEPWMDLRERCPRE